MVNRNENSYADSFVNKYQTYINFTGKVYFTMALPLVFEKKSVSLHQAHPQSNISKLVDNNLEKVLNPTMHAMHRINQLINIQFLSKLKEEEEKKTNVSYIQFIFRFGTVCLSVYFLPSCYRKIIMNFLCLSFIQPMPCNSLFYRR